MSNKLDATFHGYECECGQTHYSASELMYCQDAMAIEDKQARKKPPKPKQRVIFRGID